MNYDKINMIQKIHNIKTGVNKELEGGFRSSKAIN